VLLSHADPSHLGALARLVGREGLVAPIYATTPVKAMGEMCLYDAFMTRSDCSDFDAFNLDDVDAAFAKVIALRYHQETKICRIARKGEDTGRENGQEGGREQETVAIVTALPAGRTIGGTTWVVSCGGADFVYAPDWNNRRERHLDGARLDVMLPPRPALMVVGARSEGRPASDRPRMEDAFVGAALDVLRQEGSVLIPVDAACRVLELALLLDSRWAEAQLSYPLVFVSPVAATSIEFAKSQTEWVAEKLSRAFGRTKENPFAFRKLRVCRTIRELRRLPHGPKVVLATGPALEAGASRDLFIDWAKDPRNAVLVVEEPPEGSLAAEVLRVAEGRRRGGWRAGVDLPPELKITVSERVRLEGEELQRYAEEREEEMVRKQAEDLRRLQAQAAIAMQPDGVAAGDAAAMQASAASASRLAAAHSPASAPLAGPSAAVAIGSLAAAVVPCLVDGFVVPAGAAAPMFPDEGEWESTKFDEYGEIFDHGDLDPQASSKRAAALASEMAAEEAAEERERRGGGAGGDDAGPEAEAVQEDAPTKVESKEVPVSLAARVEYFDFTGLADGRSLRAVLARVAPRNCIIVNGSQEVRCSRFYVSCSLASLLAWDTTLRRYVSFSFTHHLSSFPSIHAGYCLSR
jgi:cleavage and polyadenylation specificity factor subunit 2